MGYDIILPPSIKPVSDEPVELVDDLTFVHRPSFARAATQRTSSGDPRWRIQRKFVLRSSERAKLMSMLQQAQGAFMTIRASPNSVQQSTAFSGAELLTNNEFINGTLGWTPTAASGTPGFTVSNGVARVTRTGTSSGSGLTQTFATVTSAAYVGRAHFLGAAELDNGTFYGVKLDTIAVQSYVFNRGLSTHARVAATTSMSFTALCIPSVSNANRFFELPYTSAQRCALVSSAWSQTCVSVVAMPSSTAGVWPAGDFIEIAGELKQLVSPLNTDANGAGIVHFRPALFATVGSGAPVIYGDPLGRFYATEIKWSNRWGLYNELSLTLDEIYES